MLLSMLAILQGQAQQPFLKWGVYARAGASFFLNQYAYDKELYHFPPGAQFRTGSLTSWMPSALHLLIIETAFDCTRTSFTAVKYNNQWSAVNFRTFSIGGGLHYRHILTKRSPYWLQTGLQLQYRINPDAVAATSFSRHGNNNNVREVLTAVYNGRPNTWETAIPVLAGRYLDKHHRHEIALFTEARISNMFRLGYEAFMRHQFTFSDGTTTSFSARINGLSVSAGLRYAFWL